MSRFAAGWHRALAAPATATGITEGQQRAGDSRRRQAGAGRHRRGADRSDRTGPWPSVSRPSGADPSDAAPKKRRERQPTPDSSKPRSRSTCTAMAPSRNDGRTQVVVTAPCREHPLGRRRAHGRQFGHRSAPGEAVLDPVPGVDLAARPHPAQPEGPAVAGVGRRSRSARRRWSRSSTPSAASSRAIATTVAVVGGLHRRPHLLADPTELGVGVLERPGAGRAVGIHHRRPPYGPTFPPCDPGRSTSPSSTGRGRSPSPTGAGRRSREHPARVRARRRPRLPLRGDRRARHRRRRAARPSTTTSSTGSPTAPARSASSTTPMCATPGRRHRADPAARRAARHLAGAAGEHRPEARRRRRAAHRGRCAAAAPSTGSASGRSPTSASPGSARPCRASARRSGPAARSSSAWPPRAPTASATLGRPAPSCRRPTATSPSSPRS